MSFWSELDCDNVVLRVTVGSDNDSDGGYDWLVKNLGGAWLGTFPGGAQRKNYAGIGFTYDADRDAFIPPQPYASWVLDETTCLWVAPIDYPADGGQYVWDELTTSWVEYEQSS